MFRCVCLNTVLPLERDITSACVQCTVLWDQFWAFHWTVKSLVHKGRLGPCKNISMLISFRENTHTHAQTLYASSDTRPCSRTAHERNATCVRLLSLWDSVINDKIYVKRDERKRHLMVSMIDGCFKWRGPGPPLLFLLISFATYSSTSIPAPSCGLRPAVYLTVHLREGLTKVKPVRGWGWWMGVWGAVVGRVSALCRCGTSLAGQCQAALWGDETGPPQWTNAL